MIWDRRIAAVGGGLMFLFLLISLPRKYDLTSSSRRRRTISPIKSRIPPPEFRMVHLDLKGGAPKLSYLRDLFPLIRASGGNGLLVEYEDMFPYEGRIRNVSAENAYEPSEIRELLRLAKENGLSVIPLIQTFGHMEHVLKLKEFGHLREIPLYPQSLCPSKNESFHLVTDMIDQLMTLHPDVQYLHIGCDEVYHLGACSKCVDRLRRLKPSSLFLNHVIRVASYIKSKYPAVKPIIWDDMLRTLPSSEIRTLKDWVEPMIWVYVEDIYRFVDGSVWTNYASVFRHVWAASAFKGAFGERLSMPDIERHYKNNKNWMKVIQREKSFVRGARVRFKGIVLTGWSRYDHFAVLCELLPAAIPSLILNLVTVSLADNDEKQVFEKVQRILQCPSSPKLKSEDYKLCSFPGVDVFLAVISFRILKENVEGLDDNSRNKQGWLTSYNIEHNFTNPWRLSESVKKYLFLPTSLMNFSRDLKESLRNIYPNSTVIEWNEQNVKPLEDKINYLFRTVKDLGMRKSWPRRPL